MAIEYVPGQKFRVLSLDGGGAKGFYTLGVLHEIEGMIKCRLRDKFDMVFGTSTGAIIAALICLGKSVDEIHDLYKAHVPKVMQAKSRADKSAALASLAETVFGDLKFDAFKTAIGIVTTKWVIERPMIFKTSIAHLRRILAAYTGYYNELRTHLSLSKDSPSHRSIQRFGQIIPRPILGGLHLEYCRM
jgi:patatin-like phospholipase/acyl hydrolase